MKQRGITQVQMILAVVALGILAAMFFAAKAYIENVRKEGYDAGHKAALLAVAQRDNEQLTGALVRIRGLEDEKAKLEQDHRDAMQAIDIKHEEDVNRVHQNKDRVIAELRRGARRLRSDGGQADAGCPSGGGGGAAGAPGAAGERHAPAQSEPGGSLDREDDGTEFTLELLAEGDEAIADLTACQAIVNDWRPRVHPH